jgi:hypothetical protein
MLANIGPTSATPTTNNNKNNNNHNTNTNTNNNNKNNNNIGLIGLLSSLMFPANHHIVPAIS